MCNGRYITTFWPSSVLRHTWNSACASCHPHFTWSQWFSANGRKMVPYGLSTSVCNSCVRQGESGYPTPWQPAMAQGCAELCCLTATLYLQDNCYMLPTVGNNQALSSRVMVKLKLTTNTWHRWLPPCVRSSVPVAVLGKGWVNVTLGYCKILFPSLGQENTIHKTSTRFSTPVA